MKKQNTKILIFLAAGTFIMSILFIIAVPFLLRFSPDMRLVETASKQVVGSTGGEIVVMGALFGDFGIALGLGLIHALSLFAVGASLVGAMILTIGGQLFQIGKEARWKQLTGKSLSIVAVILQGISLLAILFIFMIDLTLGNMGFQSAVFPGLLILLAGAVCVFGMRRIAKFQIMPRQEQQKELL